MVDLQKIVDKWSIDKGSGVMLPWLGSATCGEAATAIADALRQIAELRAELAARRDAHFSIVRETTHRAKAAAAENARLRALPLKDEVERVLEEGRKNAVAVMKALMAAGSRDNLLLADAVHRADDAARALLSRLRAGEQEGWQQCGWAYQDKKWDASHWHVCGFDYRPREAEGRLVRPVYVPAAPSPKGGES